MPTIALERQIHANLQIGRPDGITWADVSDYLSSATVELGDISGIGTGQSGVDGVVRRMTFTLRNDRVLSILIWPVDGFVFGDRVLSGDGTVDGAATDGSWLARLLDQTPDYYGDSFAPRDRLSAWNTFNGQYAPLLWPNREVVLQVAVTDPGVEPQASDWVTLFHGYLGDSIRTSGPTVECDARDLAKRLQDTYILPEAVRPYDPETPIPAETLIQNLIDDLLGAGEVTLYFPSGTAGNPRPVSESPGWMAYPRPEIWEYKSLWDAVQTVVAQFGWFLGYRWHPNTGRMQLILMEPPRTKDATTADFYLSWEDDIYTQDLEITDRDIRNVVTVTYRNAATGDRESVTVQDDTSIATYGVRAMQIEEGDASLIDTPEEAQRLANAALADLKDMTATTQLNLPLLPTLDVFSGIVVTDPRVSSTDDFYGVESVRHVLDFEARQFRTEAVAAGRVIGGHHRWLRMQTRPGARNVLTPGDWATHQTPPPPGLSLSTGLETVTQDVTAFVTATLTRPSWRYVDRYAVRLRRSDSPEWTYQETKDLSLTFRGLIGSTEYAVQAATIDARGVRGDWSTEQRITTPADTTAPAAPTGLVALTGTGKTVSLSWNANTEDDLAEYAVYRHTSNDPASATKIGEITGTRFVDINVDIGTTYWYWVTAIDHSENESAKSAGVSATPGVVPEANIDPQIRMDIDAAQAAANQALADAADAQATADGKVTTFLQASPPAATAVGDLWIDTDDGNKLYRWDGIQWVNVQDAGIGRALADAARAQATADGKIVTFYQTDAPVASAVGDLWVDTDDGNRLYRWNGSTWVDVQGIRSDPPTSLSGIGVSFGSDVVYQDAQGNSFVRVRVNLTGIPADARRAYIQVKHRRSGSTEYHLDDQLTVASGSASVTIDDLLPNTPYEFAFVPVSHFGVPGTAQTASHTTAKDATIPATPAAPTVTPAIRGIIVEVTTPNTEPDLAGYEIHVSTTSGFTPGTGTLKATLAAAPGQKARLDVVDLTAGTTYYVKLKAFDTSGNVSAASAQASAVAGKVSTSDIQFDAIEGYTVVSRIETQVITTTSTSYIDSDLVTPYLNLQAGDKVLIFAKASAWCTVGGRSTDARVRYETPSGNYFDGLETRHTSAEGDATGQLILFGVYIVPVSGQYRFAFQWRTTAPGGSGHSGMATRIIEAFVLRGAAT